MTMISVNEFKNGLTIQYNNDLWRIVEFQHVKPGKGSAFVRSKLKSLRTGAVQEYTSRSESAKVETADIQTKSMQYLYNRLVQVMHLWILALMTNWLFQMNKLVMKLTTYLKTWLLV